MDKGLTVPKWVLINRPKIPQMPQNLFAQIVCPSPKVWDFDEKKTSWGVRSLCKQQNTDLSLSHTAKHTKLYFCKDSFDSNVCKKVNEV